MFNQMHNMTNLKKYPIGILSPKGLSAVSIVQPLNNAKSGLSIMELWKDVTRYEGLYQISNLGRVKRIERRSPMPLHGKTATRRRREKILSGTINGAGYRIVELYKKGIGKYKLIHRLVLGAFMQNPQNKPCCNHKNSIRHDNTITNLEWATYSENNKHAFTHGKQKIRYGEGASYIKLTRKQVDEIREKYSDYKYTLLMLS